MRSQRKGLRGLWVGVLTVGIAVGALAVDRFPRPQFVSGHVLPATTAPAPRDGAWPWIDVALLAGCLALSGYLALKARSRKGLLALSVFSLLYFGFWRHGCVCSIGSIQNVALALSDDGYGIPPAVLAFFVLPLAFALFHGRTFCAAVCPLGALQDVVVLKPVAVPAWLGRALGLLPRVTLGLAVLLAAGGAVFPACRYDPFVGFFRLSAPPTMLAVGAVLLGIGVFIARPYCRYLCPYGVLLSWASRVSRRHVTITPDDCIQCRLCEDACPFGAIRVPAAAPSSEARTRGRRRLAGLLILLPLFVVAGAWIGWHLQTPLSRLHPSVSLAEGVWAGEHGGVETLESRSFAETGNEPDSLYAAARSVHGTMARMGGALGAWVGLCLGGRLIAESVRRRRRDYEPDRGECVSCGRCFRYCPRERVRRGGESEWGLRGRQ